VAQNVYKNKNLQGEFSDPDSPYYQGDGTETDENGNPVGNCSEINAGCTASQEELEDYIGDEIIVIGSSSESLYYYHPDHLGSASVITDGNGNLREHTEYFAFGETWVQEGASKKTPFMYTGKELDQETGLYYYGARYYDPRTSVWQSVDPILEKYLPGTDPKENSKLPGMGGFYNSGNLAGYTYTHQNPVRYVDPDGNAVFVVGGAADKAKAGTGSIVFSGYKQFSSNSSGIFSSKFTPQFFKHSESQRLQAAITEMRKENPDEPIVLMGHSWGGASATKSQRQLSNKGIDVDYLITVDPVSWFKGASGKSKGSSTKWINMFPVKRNRFKIGDFVTTLGNAWNNEKGADTNIKVQMDGTQDGHVVIMLQPLNQELLEK